MPFEKLIVNLSSKVRKEEADGKEFLVAPLRMIVPGVLNGSLGPILYLKEDIEESASKWNNIPLTLNHPPEGVAKAPKEDILGFIKNAGTDGADLVGEGWFDIEAVKARDINVYNSLTEGSKIELSTGLGMDRETAEPNASYNGQPYSHIARNYQPDHLAILPEATGACSIQDGCGVFNSIATFNELSFDDKREAIQTTIRKNATQDEPHVWVSEVYNDYFVFHKESKLLKQEYSVSDNAVTLKGNPVEVRRDVSYVPVSNSNEDKHVDKTQKIEKLIANNCGCWKEEDKEVLNSFSEEKIDALIKSSEKNAATEAVANAALEGFELEDGTKTIFNKETQKWETSEPEEKETEVNNAGQAMNEVPQTDEQFMAALPEGIRQTIENAQRIELKEKETLVRKLIANVEGDQARKEKGDFLMTKSLTELSTLADLIPSQSPAKNESRQIDWSGSEAGETPAPVKNEFSDDAKLEIPELTFAD